ncbi:MAG: DNA mismatch repair protein MutS [Nitrospirae bacterium]|nr:DNA mismatch repair protein MutS [Nitrospirota bacterium]
MSELTPLMKQYHDIKGNYPDSILFFRLGDFYEMFGQDAVTASKILQIALTTRDKGKEDAMPMCGVPHFTAENYISKLIKSGRKVALCEQVEDPKEAKGIVRREVVKVFTPGTFLPDNPKENSYILSFFQKENIFGIAVADITTGEFLLYETVSALPDEIQRFAPKEILCPSSFKDNPSISEGLDGYYLTPYEDWYFDYIESYRSLLKHFKVVSLDGYGAEGMVVAISAAGALLNYLEGTQKETLAFKKISVLKRNEYMLLDAVTQRNLEIIKNMRDGGTEGSLLGAIDETLTPMGGRLLRSWLLSPLLDTQKIIQRQDAIESLCSDQSLLRQIEEILKEIADIERLSQRIDSGSANARDLIALRDSLRLLPKLKESLTDNTDNTLKQLMSEIDSFSDVERLINSSIAENPPLSLKDGGMIKSGFNPEIDELRKISSGGKDYLLSLETRERDNTGISSLKVGFNRVFGYYIEVTKPNLPQVPAHYIRKQTIANGERFITPELKEYESKVLGAEEKLKNLEYEIFLEIRKEIAGHTVSVHKASRAVAEIDVLYSFSKIANRYNYIRPKIDESDVLEISEGRHPVIERMPLGERFIPNDTVIDTSVNNVLIITGPNMAGKSTYMRQVALIVLLAQIGSFVPAKAASVGVVDRIFTRIGASDIITKGQSTFMIEMIETANILNNATGKSLVLLDEVGRGTSTFDGISIAWAIAEYIIKNLKSRTLFATHYHELTELSLCMEGIKNLNVAVKEWGDEIIFLRRIEEGPADKSYGIQVARLAGLPEDVIARAKEVLSNLEKTELNELGAPKIAYTAETGSVKSGAGQLDLFATQADPVMKELLGLDILSMTPLEALNKLYEMRRKLSEKKED